MLIRHLEYLVTLAEERHFGRAADLCGISQPALSLAIRKLEEDLGSPLVLRGKRFVGLTAEGEKALVWGRRIMADYSHLRDDLHGRRKGGLTGTLRLGVLPEAIPLAPQIASRFEARNPLAAIAVEPMGNDKIMAGIIGGTLDGGLVRISGRRAPAGIAVTPLWPLATRFACRSDHPLAPDPVIGWDLAATQPLCVLQGGLANDLAARSIRPAISCTTLDGVMAHLRTGLWCAIVPETFATLQAAQDDIVLRPMDDADDATLHLGVAVARTDPAPPMARALAECLPKPAVAP